MNQQQPTQNQQTPDDQPLITVQGQGTPKKPGLLKNKLTKIVIGVVVVPIVILAVIVFAVFSSTGEAAKQAEGFADALIAKDFPAAYDYFGRPVNTEQSLQEFESIMTGAPFDDSCSYSISGRHVSSQSGEATRKTLTGAIECTDSTFPVELIFIDEDGTEKIAGYEVKPAQ